MKRLFWLGLGLAAGTYVTRRAQAAAQSLTPAGVGANIADGLRELGAGLGAFGAEVRAGMAEREQELTEQVARRTGDHLPTLAEIASPPEQPVAGPQHRSRPAPRPRARAPWADA